MSGARDELICPVCLDVFVNPVILNCSHNLCLGCAELVYSSQKQKLAASNVAEAGILCPLCAIWTPLNPGKGVEGLIKNLFLRNVVQELASENTKSGCSSKVYGGHASTALGDSENTLKTCEKHGKKMKLFCMDDQVLLCSNCVMFDAHKTHTFLPLSDAVKVITPDSADLIQKASAEKRWLLELKESSAFLSKAIEKDTTKVLKQAERDLNFLIGVLQSRRDTVVKLIRADQKEKEELFALHASTVTRLLSECDKLLQAQKDAAADPTTHIIWADDVKRLLESVKEAELRSLKAPRFAIDLSKSRQQIESLGVLTFPDRRGLMENEARKLVALFELGSLHPSLELIFRASVDGFAFNKFKAVYRTGQPSLLVVYLKNGYIFGGSTSVGWNYSNHWVAEPKSFLFRVSDGLSRQVVIVSPRNGRGATCSSPSGIFHWGCGISYDLQVHFNEAGHVSSYSNLGSAYTCPAGGNPKTFLAGSHTTVDFQDIEVYQVL